jgi:ATP-dependent RNA helicase RhlE
MQFNELNISKPLLDALGDLGYEHPTTIQQKAFPVILSGKDVVGIAQTGTGKTFAYLLPLLRDWKFAKQPSLQILVLVPTRELVEQVVNEVRKLSKYLTLRVVGVYGGTNINTQMTEVNKGADILVATPGRLIDLNNKGVVRLKNIKKLVIDEVDEMLNQGFRHQLHNIVDLLAERRQNIMFSATMTTDVEIFIDYAFNTPNKIEAAPSGTPLEKIKQSGYILPNFNTKINLLKLLLAEENQMSKVLIFSATKEIADRLYELLEPKHQGKIGIIHSNKSQNFRLNSVRQFHAGNFNILIATDLVARGLDIAEVSHVINFGLPEISENYIHRIGRTGRADKEGIAISLLTEREIKKLEAIEEFMNAKVPRETLPENLEISQTLTKDEMPKVQMPNMDVKFGVYEPSGAAFHDKKPKNMKENFSLTRGEKLKLKYGKPKTRGQKKKGGK